MLWAMSQPLKLMRESFSLLGRNLVLFYPVLGFFIAMDLIRPPITTAPGLDMRWILIFSVLLLLKAAFASGWFNMVYEVTFKSRLKKNEALKNDNKDTFQRVGDLNSKPLSPHTVSSESGPLVLSDSLSLFKQFFPGIGQYFLSLTFGMLIMTGVFFVIFWLIQQDVQNTIGYPTEVFHRFSEFLSQGPEGQDDMKDYIESMSMTDQEQLSAFLSKQLTGVFASLLFVLMTIFWIPLLMVRRVGVLQAYWQSVKLFFREPLKLSLLGIVYGVTLLFTLLLSSMNAFFSIIFVFLFILVGIAVGIFMFLYVFDYVIDDCGESIEALSMASNEVEAPQELSP